MNLDVDLGFDRLGNSVTDCRLVVVVLHVVEERQVLGVLALLGGVAEADRGVEQLERAQKLSLGIVLDLDVGGGDPSTSIVEVDPQVLTADEVDAVLNRLLALPDEHDALARGIDQLRRQVEREFHEYPYCRGAGGLLKQ